MKRKINIWKLLFWAYIIALFVVVVIKFRGSFSELSDKIGLWKMHRMDGFWNINLIPLHSLRSQFKHITEWWALKNILGNFIPFIPFGVLLPLAYPQYNRLGRVFIISLFTVLAIESYQFITMLGSFDVDDIILNTIGMILGYAGFVLQQLGKRNDKIN